MKIDGHIHQLLFRYDCVIVPEFGGFVGNYAPASIHPVHHTFTPPSKRISFNKNLRTNDGLLANHIAGTENIGYDKANQVISDYVLICNKQLAQHKRFNIDQVGSLTMDLEGNLQFEADSSVNYLTESFGLGSFTSAAIKRESIEKRIERQIKDREPIPQQKKKSYRRRYVAAALTLPILFALVWIPLKTDLLQQVDYSALNPFAEKVKSEYRLRKAAELALTEKDFEAEPFISVNDTITYKQISLLNDPNERIVVRLREELAAARAEADKTAVATSKRSLAGLHFHVVGGCFQVLENANKYIAQLKEKNITASIIGKTPAGLNIVSCGDYATREEALTALDKIRATNTDAWLLKK